MFCPNGKYSAVAQLYFRSPEESVKALFHDPIGDNMHKLPLLNPNISFLISGTFKPLTLALFAIIYWILTMWTYGVSVPSGLFIPSLLTGVHVFVFLVLLFFF